MIHNDKLDSFCLAQHFFGTMPQLSNWREFAVQQRRPNSGCIPTGYEMLVRAAGLTGIALDSFQDDFDLDRDRTPDTPPRNNFESVAAAVQARYPHVQFRRLAFARGRGNEKLAFIESCLAAQRPVLVSVSLHGLGLKPGWHIMLTLGDDGDVLLLLNRLLPDGKGEVLRVAKSEIVRVHDSFDGGDDVAVLDES